MAIEFGFGPGVGGDHFGGAFEGVTFARIEGDGNEVGNDGLGDAGNERRAG